MELPTYHPHYDTTQQDFRWFTNERPSVAQPFASEATPLPYRSPEYPAEPIEYDISTDTLERVIVGLRAIGRAPVPTTPPIYTGEPYDRRPLREQPTPPRVERNTPQRTEQEWDRLFNAFVQNSTLPSPSLPDRHRGVHRANNALPFMPGSRYRGGHRAESRIKQFGVRTLQRLGFLAAASSVAYSAAEIVASHASY